MTETCKNLLT